MSCLYNCSMNKLLFITVFFLFSCKEKKQPLISFYYWKSVYALPGKDSAFIQYNHIEKLYIKYFDVVFDSKDSIAKPIAVIQFKQAPVKHIPVIFIKNNVFENADSTNIPSLADSIIHLVKHIQVSQNITTASIQFDCDWTERTKNKYFYFLQSYQTKTHQTISATIRLHQVKYFYKTGIPPVNKGILMFYNIGNINSDENENSIYNPGLAGKYVTSLKNYPLDLDVALPVFSWGILIRNNQVVHLLNKMDFTNFQDTKYFSEISKNKYLVKNSLFKGGYYLMQGDEIKIENVEAVALMNMAKICSSYLKKQPGEIIFYDFDQENFKNYETNFFQQIQDCFH